MIYEETWCCGRVKRGPGIQRRPPSQREAKVAQPEFRPSVWLPVLSPRIWTYCPRLHLLGGSHCSPTGAPPAQTLTHSDVGLHCPLADALDSRRCSRQVGLGSWSQERNGSEGWRNGNRVAAEGREVAPLPSHPLSRTWQGMGVSPH